MIRTVQQWLTSPEFEALAKGGTLASFIEAVQRDAVEACALLIECNIEADEQSIRALIPPKPKETP